MKIFCPDCKASYDVDLPDLTEKGSQVECAECQHSFLVTPETRPVGSSDSALPDSPEGEDHALKSPAEDNLDDMQDHLIDEEHEKNDTEDSPELDSMLDDLIGGDMSPSEETTTDDSAEPELDSMLDDLIGGDMSPSEETTTDDSAEPELDSMLDDLIGGDISPSEETTTDDSAEPELDSMLDDLISDDTQTSTEEGPEEAPLDLVDGEESELDTMADDATNDKAAPDSSEIEEDINPDSDDDLDGLLDDILNDDDEEIDTPEEKVTAPETEDNVDDILGDILSEFDTEESAVEPEAESGIETETAEEAQEDSAAAGDPLQDMSEKDMSTETFADQEATDETVEENTKEEAEENEEDQETPPAAGDPLQDMSEKDMSAETFADQEATDEAVEENTKEEAEDDEEDDDEEAEDDEEDEDDDDEEAEDDYPEDDEEEQIKIGPISVPATRTGKMMLAGGVLGLLVTAGGAYFAWQTFMPPELTEVTKTEAEVPEGLTPKPDKEKVPVASEEALGKSETKPEKVKKPAKPAVLGEVGEDTKSEIAQKLAKSKILSESSESVEVIEKDSEGFVAALSPEAKMVKFSTIMPVAFDVNDIKVLSFTLAVTFTDEASAQVMQSALPFFEETTVKIVEKFLAKKFYNDILYVKEKLAKRLQLAYNKKIDSDGRVKKIKFEEFLIQ